MTVTHGAFSAEKSDISLPVNHAAGETLVVKIAPRDAWSNAYAARDVSFSATVTPSGGSTFTPASSTPTGAAMDDDGRFVVAFPASATAAVGRYDVDVFHSPGGARVGSRTSLNVVAGDANGMNSKIKPSGSSSVARASWTDTFGLVIDARDARGNAVTDPDVALKTTVTATVEPLEGFEAWVGDVVTRRVDGSFRSGFIPRVPGTYSVTATFPGETVTSPHVVRVHLAPAPRLVRARMADSLGSIDVSFDAPTDRALSGGSCAGLLSDETVRILGTGAHCAWSNDFVLTLHRQRPIAMP